MSGANRFPRRPDIHRENPFEDKTGQNPFADGTPDTPLSVDPLAAPLHAELQPYRPGDYETLLPHRAGLVLTLGCTGLAAVLLAHGIALVANVATARWGDGFAFGVPLALAGLACACPAWLLGRNDRRAIQAGAMDAAGRARTRVGQLMGVVGTAGGTLLIVSCLVALIAESLSG